MKSMKGLGMNKMLGTIKRRATSGLSTSSAAEDIPEPQGDAPEAIAVRSVKQFCSSGGPNSQGDEVLFLPPIVDAAESSPAAAAMCAQMIRKFLTKDYHSKPSYQYNAIMLIRILTDNPGPTFTRNMDKKFVDTCKELLRAGKDPSVRTMLMETLDTFEYSKAEDEGLHLIIEMWKKEKEKAYKSYGHRMPPQQTGPRTLNAPPFDPNNQNYFSRNHQNKKLPDPVQLAARLEEARTSAKLLAQVVGHTPPHEILSNDLIKEFADRCNSASRSIQGYMVADSPAPDNDTMESLIDTNEQLQSALNTHQRAVLSARKQLGIGERSPTDTPSPVSPLEANGNGNRPAIPQQLSSGSIPPPLPSRNNGKGKETAVYAPPSGPPPSNNKDLPDQPAEDPFKDPEPSTNKAGSGPGPGAGSITLEEPRLAFEPFHPGFQGTQSYMDRQDSAVGKLHMHGAGASSSSSTPAPPGEGSSSKQPAKPEEEDDLYESTPRSKEPMYRY